MNYLKSVMRPYTRSLYTGKASNKTWEQLITALGFILEIDIQPGYPNQTDRNQT
ncbi:hypothetical protein [Xanthocytophaga agilis]|uniref:Uncharacterized protein n=1 Tax=Xanthocytophaga agilis TaxID=3048010 RepID=A0AAE3R7L3_9BACT|nr:hypothetical protein [Xanthocytophaga agilis]MDJ1502237.1 hypothetical protein [Xanthocytophaga agilis]